MTIKKKKELQDNLTKEVRTVVLLLFSLLRKVRIYYFYPTFFAKYNKEDTE